MNYTKYTQASSNRAAIHRSNMELYKVAEYAILNEDYDLYRKVQEAQNAIARIADLQDEAINKMLGKVGA